MVIKRLAIRNFGKIHDTALELTPGINVLYGENESGKSTVHTFIKSMLYGMQRSRGRAAKKDMYAKYQPWENPGEFGGNIWLEKDEKVYRLSRSFAKENSTEELYCETDSELLDIEEGDLDDLLGGVSETVYENTVSVGQLKSVTGKDLVQELQNYMISYQGTGDASVDLGRAVQMLKMTRKGYAVQEERLNKAREAERARIRSNYAYIQQELEEAKGKKNSIEQKNAQGRTDTRAERKAVEKQLSDLGNMNKAFKLGMFFTAVIAALLVILFTAAVPGLSFLGLLIFIAGVLGVIAEFFYSRKIEIQIKECRKKLRILKKQDEKRNWDEERFSEILSEKQTALANLRTELKEFESQNEALTQAQIEVDALTLAMETMEDLTREFRSNVGLNLRKRTSEILSEITDGKYDKVLIDFDFRIQVSTEDRIVSLDSLSRGTMEQIYFALRMAAGELLCGNANFPVILDDVFGMYDEERLAAVLHWLEKEPRQVIISTCHKREMEILEKEGIAFHALSLDVETE